MRSSVSKTLKIVKRTRQRGPGMQSGYKGTPA
jgi:hypothetical protein